MSGRDSRSEPRLEGGGDHDLRLTDEDRIAMLGSGGGRDSGRRQKKPRAERPRRRRSVLGRLIRGMVAVGFMGVAAVGGVLVYFASQLPPTRDLAIPNRPPNVAMVGAAGATFANRGAGGEALRLEEMPKHLPQAVIAIEDQRYYSHYGLDPIGLARAFARNMQAGAVVEGGSTLTQQLAKNLFLTPERTLSRKIQELILSVWLETEYSKERILETYLNRVYLGAGAYGVEAAAQRYFDKSARHVTLLEAAVLAGLLKAPSRYSPARNAEGARERAELVLSKMVEAGFVSQEEVKTALSDKLKVAGGGKQSSVNYVADWVMDQVEGFIGEVDQDVIVETTVDLKMQEAAEKAIREGLKEQGKKLNASQGALVSIDGNGAVKALVGGRSYAESPFNRAVTAKRQPGSAFKPFVYLAALERGMTPNTVRVDEPVSFDGWSPENYNHKYRGPVTLRSALSSSLNTIAAKLAMEVGPETVVQTAYRMGVSSKLQPNASIALGTSEVTPLELTAAFVPFANGGFSVTPYAITRIRTKDGRTLYERKAATPEMVLAPHHVAEMNSMMTQTVTSGTARRADLPGWQAAGKTGTSQNFRDAWFVGYTTALVTSVWFGNDDNEPMKRATGGSLPATVWSQYMQAASAELIAAPLPGLDESGHLMTASSEEVLPWQRAEAPPAYEERRRPRRHYDDAPDPVTGFFRRLFGD